MRLYDNLVFVVGSPFLAWCASLTAVAAKAATIYKVKGAANSEHSISEEERSAFAIHINNVLSSDPFLSQGSGDATAPRLPMDPNTDELFTQCADGIIFAKLVNLVEPGTVDERALNMKKKITKFQVIENCNLAINAAKAIGCRVTNIGASDLMEGRPHLVLGIAWQIIRASLLSKISLKDHPELFRLLKEGETLEDLMKLPPEQILIRWVNFHLERGQSDRRIANFSSDLADSEAYSVLLHQLDPAKCPLVTGSDRLTRAEVVVANVTALGVDSFTRAQDIVKGNSKLNLGLLAQLFNANPGLAELTAEDMEQIGDQLASLDLDDAGDTREERTFRMWINSLDIDGLYINDLFADLCSGIAILQIMDRMRPGCVNWKRINTKPKNRIHVVDNCNNVVRIGKETLDLVLVNIGGIDVADKNKKLILAIMWQLMRRFILDMLAALTDGKSKITEERMVQWANAQVQQSTRKTGPASIRNLNDATLGNGMFLISLCGAVSPSTVDWDLIATGNTDEDKLNNARYAISIARKIGATVFLTPEDIVEIKPKMIFTFIGSLWTVAASSSSPMPVPPTTPTKAPASPTAPKAIPTPKPPTPSPPNTAKPADKSWMKPKEPATTTEATSSQPPPAPASVAPSSFRKPAPPTKRTTPTKPPATPPGPPLNIAPVSISAASTGKASSTFNSVNGTGETGGMYGSKSNAVSNDDDVAEDEWSDED